ncbi:hypothetical protein EXIGLDRAFT_734537 [Exidia glandulosa HHB12029]|uniref:GH16 domain-containing protein n=1 Tax=Exidia glandulosa HHB12029 TaxID=1314781 RepID=A0A165PN27_EXIGL|nr:hypothetical protein EXIGLDRAFT_734537 [Exidia glandulosa HHB12029]
MLRLGLVLAFSALAVDVVALSLSLPSLSMFSRRATTTIAEPSIIWIPQDVYRGDTFFDEWDFFSDKDPTNGMVNYLPREKAMAGDNAFAYLDKNDQVVMRVDNWTTLQPGQYRDSVRISTKKLYNRGLFILDVAHSPYGCSVWPGYWTLGMAQQWPASGEIDILEGVHNNQHDQVTWHTAPGCNLTAPGNFSGTSISTNCYANEVGGCGIVDWSRASYGPLFNALGGGVYAMRWDESAIDVWFFYRAAVPTDITLGAPDPTLENWGTPSASLSNTGCDLDKYFVDHAIVFDITVCGDWAGASYQQDGCPGSCIDRVMDPTSFDNASWVINSLSVYQKKTVQGRVTNNGAFSSAPALYVLAIALSLLTSLL